MASLGESAIQRTDDDLVEAATFGDLAAFNELVRRFRGAVTAIARHATGSRELAEDVAQEALVLAYKALPQLTDRSRFASWLFAITRHRAKTMAAKESSQVPVEMSALDRLIVAKTAELSQPHPNDDLAEKVEALEREMSDLPGEYRDVLSLYYGEGWRIARIAGFLSLPATTVKWRLHHGRELLRRKMTQVSEECYVK